MPEGIWKQLLLGENPSQEDILLFGIKSEKEAALLYKRFAANIGNKLARNKFENLALEEEYHAQQIEDAHLRILGKKAPAAKVSGDFVKDIFFEDMSLVKALLFAIDNEARARKFYLTMSERARSENARNMFRYFAETERSHQMILEAELYCIKNEGDKDKPWTFKRL